jgi:hypothetical protein
VAPIIAANDSEMNAIALRAAGKYPFVNADCTRKYLVTPVIIVSIYRIDV